MIKVTVEFISATDGHRELLGTGLIANDGTGTISSGNYKVTLSTRGGRRVWRSGQVTGFPRKQLNVWHLLRRSLDAAQVI